MKRQEFRQKSNWQLIFALIIIIFSIYIYLYLNNSVEINLATSWAFGLIVGFILQRSRICFTAALRDPFLFGLTKLSRALILSTIIITIGFAYIQYQQQLGGLPIEGKFVPLGWHIPIGAFIFGLGAAVSGGCASGTLTRLGEGYKLQWIVIVGFIAGSVHGSYDASFWYQLIRSQKSTHLPQLLGWGNALALQIIFLLLLYLLSYWWEKHKF